MTVREPLSQILSRVKFWYNVPGGFSPTFSWTDTQGKEIYTASEFEVIDPRLIELLCSSEYVAGTYLTTALDYWTRPRITLPKRHNVSGRFIGEYSVKTFESFTAVSGLSDVTVKFMNYELASSTSGFLYPVSCQPFQTDTPRYWLNEHYPKWQEHSLLAQSLELDSEALTRLIIGSGTEVVPLAVPQLEL